MFKKLLSSALCLSMLLSTAIPAFATDLTETTSGQTIVTYGMSESFTVVIPGNFTIGNDGSASANVSAENVMLGANKSLAVTISGDDYVDKWELIDQAEATNKLTYTIGSTEGAADIVNDSIVLLVGAGEAYNSIVTETLYFTVVDELTKSGTYDDVLTFTVYVDGTNVLEGSGQTFHRLAPSALSFRSQEPLSEFQEVLINGETLDESNYTLTEGSTIVTLDIDYLQSLPTDTYTVEIVSKNKAPSGSFRVVEPITNSHGFYYNQPYTGSIEFLDTLLDVAFFIREDNTLDGIAIGGSTEVCTYTVSNDKLYVTSASFGDLTFNISDNGNRLHNVEFNTDFIIGDEKIVADNEYIYYYDDSGLMVGYRAATIHKNKTSYEKIASNINEIPVISLVHGAFEDNIKLAKIPDIPGDMIYLGEFSFSNCDSLTTVTIPGNILYIEYHTFADCDNLKSVTIEDGVDYIGDYAFVNCSGLEKVTISKTVKQIYGSAFRDCIALKEIRFNGTVDEWNNITISSDWNYNVPATQIICSDGVVDL